MRLPFIITKKNYQFEINDKYSFGAVKKENIHTGIKLHCADRFIYTIESGKIINILPYFKTSGNNKLYSVMIEGESGVFLYGGIRPSRYLKIGNYVDRQHYIGEALLHHNSKLMLHLELYKYGTVEPVQWLTTENKPSNLLDPTNIIRYLYEKNLRIKFIKYYKTKKIENYVIRTTFLSDYKCSFSIEKYMSNSFLIINLNHKKIMS